MSKPLYPGILAGLLLIIISMACRLISFDQAAPPETETPVPTVLPTKTNTPTATSRPANTATIAPIATRVVATIQLTPKFAPFCQPSSASIATPVTCDMPIAEQSSSYCQGKIPYNLILMNQGSTYEMENDHIECSVAGEKNGKLIVLCTGRLATSFEMKVCDPACGIQPFQAGVTSCPQDTRYNDLLHCCEREPIPVDQNCITLSLRTRSCAIDCGEFVDQKTCDKNAYACTWDSETNVCLLRK